MIRVEVLGGLRVFSEGRELSGLPASPKRSALLVYLAVKRKASRDELCFLLWPDSHNVRARRALSQNMSALKADLGPWVEVVGDSLVVTSELQVDLEQLREAERDGRHADVIELYGGPFLDHVPLAGGPEFDQWIDGTRSALHRQVRGALKAVTASAQPPQERVRLARRWVELDPLDDEAQHALIEALALADGRGAALKQFDDYRELIKTELELDPLEGTCELVERIRRGVVKRSDPSTPEEEEGRRDAARSESDRGTGIEPPRTDGIPDLGSDFDHVRPLRSGIIGTVYQAWEPALQRKVAVKVLRPELAEDHEAKERFRREARSAAKIRHDHVAMVHRVGVTGDGRPFFVMPLIRSTLADHLQTVGALSQREIARICSEVASALAEAHAKGVIHRDVRPGSVLYETETGKAYLGEFGVAGVLESDSEAVTLLTQKEQVLGTPEYVSPEQQEGKKLDGRSDVYSLGVMGVELLTGEPSRDPSVLEEVDAQDPEIVELIRRSLAEDPVDRPDAEELADAFEGVFNRHGRPLGFLGQLRKRRLPQFFAGYLAAGLAGMGGVDQLVQQGLLGAVAYRLALAFFVAGLMVTIVLAWFHGERGRQRMSAAEAVLLSVTVVAWAVVTVLMLE